MFVRLCIGAKSRILYFRWLNLTYFLVVSKKEQREAEIIESNRLAADQEKQIRDQLAKIEAQKDALVEHANKKSINARRRAEAKVRHQQHPVDSGSEKPKHNYLRKGKGESSGIRENATTSIPEQSGRLVRVSSYLIAEGQLK